MADNQPQPSPDLFPLSVVFSLNGQARKKICVVGNMPCRNPENDIFRSDLFPHARGTLYDEGPDHAEEFL